MVRSMTGYGREQSVQNGREILVEIRSVNHRFYEFSARVPRVYGYLEEKLKSLLQGNITRGKVEVSVSVRSTEGKDAAVVVNAGMVQSYLEALRGIGETMNLPDDLSLSHVLRFPEAFTVSKTEENEEEIWSLVQGAASLALDRFIAMRETEGARLKEDILGRIAVLGDYVRQIENRSPTVTELYRTRLLAKLRETLADTKVEEQRILTEAAIFSEKTAVDEETVRLRSHLKQLSTILSQDGAIGKKLDFIVQECNRETNTIGSKAQDLEITRMVVDMKSEIEKIREQVQNIE